MPVRWEEKRAFPRVSINTPLRWQVVGSEEYSNATGSDIGLGGVGFTNDKFLAIDTRLSLNIKVLSRIINPVGRIVRIDSLPYSERYRIGIEFQELPPDQKKMLSDYINLRLEKF